MTRWLAHGITFVVMMSSCGCVSSPPRMPAEDIGFTRAPQVGGQTICGSCATMEQANRF